MKYALISEDEIKQLRDAIYAPLNKDPFAVLNAGAILKSLKPSEPVAWAAPSIYGGFEGLSFDKQPRFGTPLYKLDGEQA